MNENHATLLLKLLENLEQTSENLRKTIENAPKKKINHDKIEHTLKDCLKVCNSLSLWHSFEDVRDTEEVDPMMDETQSEESEENEDSGDSSSTASTEVTSVDTSKGSEDSHQQGNSIVNNISPMRQGNYSINSVERAEQYWLSVDAFNAYAQVEIEKSLQEAKHGISEAELLQRHDYAFPRSKIQWNKSPLTSEVLLSTVFRSNEYFDELEESMLRAVPIATMHLSSKYSNAELHTIHVRGRGSAWYDLKTTLDNTLPLFTDVEKHLIGVEIRNHFTTSNDLDGVPDIILTEKPLEQDEDQEDKKREKYLKKKKYIKPKKKKKKKKEL